jgi:epoxyqueuosine reductase
MFLHRPIPDRRKKLKSMTPLQIKEAIKTEVTNLGFLLSGITTPDPIESYPQFEQWIQAGYHAEMHYLSRPSSMEKRRNPALIMPSAKSILVLGIPYPAPKESGFLNIASYAQGSDYHNLIPKRLSGFQFWLEDLVGYSVQTRIFTDTAPVMEKPLAIRAGLGWIGKNGLVIHPEYGSFFFLTEIFMNIELPPDNLFKKDLCGDCTLCIENCPTSAILSHHQIDSNRCLSYITIEKKGMFTEDQSNSIKESIFGCDQCQLICPWNQKRIVDDKIPTLFQTDEVLAHFTTQEILNLSSEAFSTQFAYTPISRTKRFGLIRNLLALLSNTGKKEILPVLQDFIDNEDNENLRTMAIRAQVNILGRD